MDDRPPDESRAARARFQKVLLATDLTPASDRAAVQALELAVGLDATLLVVSVIDPGQLRRTGGSEQRIDQARAEREVAAKALVEEGRRLGIPVHFLIWEGEPGEAIVEAAVAEEADIIVVGSRGRTGVGRMILGSVSDHVVRHANCPVVVVRQREDGPAEP